jgi:hypothetical protein
MKPVWLLGRLGLAAAVPLPSVQRVPSHAI